MKLYFKDKNSILSDIRRYFEITEIPSEADAALLWRDGDYRRLIGEIQPFIDAGKREKHLPLIMYQHGGYIGTNRPYANIFAKYLSKYLIWGEEQIQFLLGDQVPPEKIVITSTPIFDKLKPRRRHSGTNVLYAPISCRLEWYPNFEMAKELRKSGLNIITKITNVNEPDKYDNVICSHVDESWHWDMVIDVLRDADIVVSPEDSTIEMLARYLDIPVVMHLPEKYETVVGFVDTALKERNVKWVMPGAKRVTRLEDLNGAIRQQLDHPEELRKERQECLRTWGGVGVVKDPLKKIVEEIKCFEPKHGDVPA